MRRYRRTTLITIFCLGVMAGLGLARAVKFSVPAYCIFLAPLLIFLKGRRAAAMIIVVTAGLVLGLWRGGLYMSHLQDLQSLAERQVTITVTAATDSVYGKRSQVQFTGGHIKMTAPYVQNLAGTFKLSGFGEKMIYRGDRVRVSGKLYPSRGANQATIAYAKLTKLSDGHSWYADINRKFSAGMQNALPEPLASFAMGLLIGQRNNLPADITVALTAVGLVHIIAVSGYNLTIIVRAVGRLKLGSKYQKLIISLGLIAAFVMVTGFSASIVRAALVSVLSLWAWYYGRRLKPMVLISLAAAVTAFWNPFYIWGDISWYLSFLAFFGVLVIAPLISARLFREQPRLMTSVLLETLSAEVMTLPLILMTFSQLSIIALLANVLIVPLVPLAMLLAGIAGAAGMLSPALAGWFALPARLLLTYMLDIVHLLSTIPSVLIHRSISLPYMLSLYLMVLGLVVMIAHRNRRKTQNIKPQPHDLYLTP